MARERKTVDVEWVRNLINNQILHALDASQRATLSNTLSDVLMEANRYRGFYYCDKQGNPVKYEEGVTDTSMRQYY